MNTPLFNRLSRFMVERTHRGYTPGPAITTPQELVPDLRSFSDNRARYIQQSAATVAGCVAPLPPRRAA